MKIAHIDNNNKLLGWYDTDIHSNIPTPNIEVSDEQWQVAIDNGYNTFKDDKFSFIAPPDTRTYAEKRQAEYPPMADYLDAIVKNDTVTQQEYIDKCLAVKAKYPKG